MVAAAYGSRQGQQSQIEGNGSGWSRLIVSRQIHRSALTNMRVGNAIRCAGQRKGELIMKFLSRASLFFLFGLYLLLVPAFAAERPYYQGKNITFFINFSAGGPTDIEGRIVARHLAKHIPGQPTLIPQNMAGAGGMTEMNFLGEMAKPDGQTLGYFTGPYNHQMMRTPSLRIDLMKLPFIASIQGVTVCYIRSDVPPGIKKPTDIV